MHQDDKDATRGLICETMNHISAQGDSGRQQDQMHELSFYYMSFLRDRAARRGPQRGPPPAQAAARREHALAQHAELAQRLQQLRTQIPYMAPHDQALAQQQLQFMMQQEHELRLQINASV